MKQNELALYGLNGYQSAIRIARYLHEMAVLNNRKQKLTLLIDANEPAYPNACVPLAAMIDYYRERNVQVSLKFVGEEDAYVTSLNLEKPIAVEDLSNPYDLSSPFNKIWCFSSSKGENDLVTAFADALMKTDECERNIYSALEWCLNETMDNILMHSESGKGYVMAQYHVSSKLFSVCIFDCGIGILESFKHSKKHHPKSALDAITLALQARVTRDDSIGQGNGLWGLHNIILENHGSLRIVSDGACWNGISDSEHPIDAPFTKNGVRYLFGNGVGSTMIDFQMHTNRAVDMAQALNREDAPELWSEKYETNDGVFYLSVADESQGTGTRPAARELRNLILNIISGENKRIILDFQNVGTLSSSYADELIGKLIGMKGILFFNKKVEIQHISPTNASILEHSVRQRMAQMYYGERIVDDD